MKLKLKVSKKEVRLEDLPAGLFLHGNTLGFKTEYNNEDPSKWVESYCVESGEAFWGGVSSIDSQRGLLVRRVKVVVNKIHNIVFRDSVLTTKNKSVQDFLEGFCKNKNKTIKIS